MHFLSSALSLLKINLYSSRDPTEAGVGSKKASEFFVSRKKNRAEKTAGSPFPQKRKISEVCSRPSRNLRTEKSAPFGRSCKKFEARAEVLQGTDELSNQKVDLSVTPPLSVGVAL